MGGGGADEGREGAKRALTTEAMRGADTGGGRPAALIVGFERSDQERLREARGEAAAMRDFGGREKREERGWTGGKKRMTGEKSAEELEKRKKGDIKRQKERSPIKRKTKAAKTDRQTTPPETDRMAPSNINPGNSTKPSLCNATGPASDRGLSFNTTSRRKGCLSSSA